MNKKVEEVKKILDTYLGRPNEANFLEEWDKKKHNAAQQICQLKDAEIAELTRVSELQDDFMQQLEKKDAECQQRVERIFREIEKHRWQGHKSMVGFDPPKGYLLSEDDWQALMKEQGVQ